MSATTSTDYLIVKRALVDPTNKTLQANLNLTNVTPTAIGNAPPNYFFPPNATTLVGTDSVQTLTNKNIGISNTVQTDFLKTTTTTAPVNIVAAPPVTGQALVATSATTATWQIPNAHAIDLITNVAGIYVNVSNAAPPVAGQALVATANNAAVWKIPNAHAIDLITNTGTYVNVSNSAPPTAAGQVLVSTSATAATWQAPPATSNVRNYFNGVLQTATSTALINYVANQNVTATVGALGIGLILQPVTFYITSTGTSTGTALYTSLTAADFFVSVKQPVTGIITGLLSLTVSANIIAVTANSVTVGFGTVGTLLSTTTITAYLQVIGN